MPPLLSNKGGTKTDSRKNKNCKKTSVPFQVGPSGEMAVVQGAEVNVNIGKLKLSKTEPNRSTQLALLTSGS